MKQSKEQKVIFGGIFVTLVLLVLIALAYNEAIDYQIGVGDWISYTREDAHLYGRVWPEGVDDRIPMVDYLRHNRLSPLYLIKLLAGTALVVAVGMLFSWICQIRRTEKPADFMGTYSPVLFFVATLFVVFVAIPAETWERSLYNLDWHLLIQYGFDMTRIPGFFLLEPEARPFLGKCVFVLVGVWSLCTSPRTGAKRKKLTNIFALLSGVCLVVIVFFLRLQIWYLIVTMIWLGLMALTLAWMR